jgi:MoaA/NifB/PqqE/SkfB family radical SAM enzyme
MDRSPPRTGLAQLDFLERFSAIYRYVHHRLRHGLLSLTFEVTKRCNARCDFCDHWKEPKRDEGVDFVDVVRRLDPMVVIYCGGEPLMRKNMIEVIRDVAAVPGWRYHILITNGWLLSAERGLELERAGLHQINVSLNWPDDRQSAERRLKGLFGRIERAVPALTSQGVEINLNTMIMRDNLHQVADIARLAVEWGAKVTYTLYSEYCNGNDSHQIRPEEAGALAEVIEELIELKDRYQHITNNKYYLRTCVDFVSGRRIPDCPAAKKMLHVTPQGMVKPCADLEPICHYTEFDRAGYPGVDCDICWMACRGEVQAPVNLERVREVVGW